MGLFGNNDTNKQNSQLHPKAAEMFKNQELQKQFYTHVRTLTRIKNLMQEGEENTTTLERTYKSLNQGVTKEVREATARAYEPIISQLRDLIDKERQNLRTFRGFKEKTERVTDMFLSKTGPKNSLDDNFSRIVNKMFKDLDRMEQECDELDKRLAYVARELLGIINKLDEDPMHNSWVPELDGLIAMFARIKTLCNLLIQDIGRVTQEFKMIEKLTI